MICSVVFTFPPSSAAITISFESATTLSPVTKNSLTMMMIALEGGFPQTAAFFSGVYDAHCLVLLRLCS